MFGSFVPGKRTGGGWATFSGPSANPTPGPTRWSTSVAAWSSRCCLRAKTNSRCPTPPSLSQVANDIFPLKNLTRCNLYFKLVFLFSSAFKSTDENSLAWGLFGRIGVSLMLRYHKTHQWAKVNETVVLLRHCEEMLECRHV